MLRNYFAAYEQTAEAVDESLLDVMDFRLVSYYLMKSGQHDDLFFRKYRDRYTSIILDSGAFTAWTKKQEISFNDYIKYCKKYANKVDYFVNLDRIPHVKSEEEAEEKPEVIIGSAEGGYRNYKDMVRELAQVGVPKERIIHVYHQFEPIEYLERMVNEDRMDYIGLSACNAVSLPKKRKFFEKCFEVVGKERPKCKTHAFGLSSFDLLRAFPFYSVDARTWGSQASQSTIFVPEFRDIDSKFGDPLEVRWDFSKLTSFDVGNLTKKDSYVDKKWRGTRQATASYRIKLRAYIYDVDREYPFPLVNGHELMLGESVLHQKSNREPVGPNEHEIDPNSKLFERLERHHGKVPSGQMLTEEIIDYGLVNDLQWRMKINIIGFNYFVRQLDPVGYQEFQQVRKK